MKKKVFAILAEPASYTVDRNKEVYDPLGIKYGYIYSKSIAKAQDVDQVKAYSELSFWQLYKEMKRIVREHDVIIMNGYTGRTFRALFLANLFVRKPIGIDSDTQLMIPSNPIKRLVKHITLYFLFSRKWMYGLPGGNYSHKDLFRHYGMPEERIFLMPMVVSNEKFYCKDKVKGNTFNFLFVGRLIPLKNLYVLCDAFNMAFHDRNDVILYIVGDGEEYDRLNNYIKNIPSIKLCGSKFGEELSQIYHQSHVFILPSWFEQWGLVVNEAMAAGMPVIVSNKVGSAYDLVNNNDTGFIFPYNDPGKLSECMRKFTDDVQLYKRYADNAYHFMHDHWNYDFYKECLLKFIESV